MKNKKIVKLSASSWDIVNSLRASLGTNFQAMVPIALVEGTLKDDGTPVTQTEALLSLRAYGEAVTSDVSLQNMFVSSLMNRIAKVIFSSKLWTNPLKIFKKGTIEYGEVIEEVFIDLIQSQNYNPVVAEIEYFKREIPDVRTSFHVLNHMKMYKATTHDRDLRRAFLTSNGVTDFISKVVETMLKSAQYDEYLLTKYLIAVQLLKGKIYPQKLDITNNETIVKTIKELSNNLQFLSTKYNKAHVSNDTPKEKQYVIATSKFSAHASVEVLAKAFNVAHVEYADKEVLIDSFSFNSDELERLKELMKGTVNFTDFTSEQLEALKKVPAVVVSGDYIMIHDYDEIMDSEYNKQGLYFNHFLHVHQSYSVSPFENAIALTSIDNDVTKVTLTPSKASVTKGQSVQFLATVTTTGFSDKSVKWVLEGSDDVSGQDGLKHSVITDNGLLLVGGEETATTLTVNVISKVKDSVEASATVTVVASA